MVPVPFKVSVWGLPESVSVTFSVPAREPVAPGVKVSVIVHVPPLPATTADVHKLLVMAKSPASVPVIVTVSMVTEVVPLFVKVTVTGVLVLPTATLPKDAGEGESVISVPFPLSGTACGLPQALSAISRSADCLPRAVGVNVTFTVQLAPAAKFAPQPLDIMANSAASVPPRVMPEIERAFVPEFVTFTDCAAPVVLMSWLGKLTLEGNLTTGDPL